MRRSVWMCVLMMTLLLSGCGGGRQDAGPQERALAIRGAYLSAGGCAARMEVTADYGQRVYTYTVGVTVTGEECVLTVLAPEEVAGVTARMAGETGWLEYDGTVLETGVLSDDGLTPLGALPALLESVRSGFMDSCTPEQMGERDTLRVLYRDPSVEAGRGREITVWFDLQTNALIRGEILVDGRRVILCECSEFTLM